MANVNIVMKVGIVWCVDDVSGESCAACGDKIYGKGHRIIFTTQTEKQDLPKFRESKVVVCQSCKNTFE